MRVILSKSFISGSMLYRKVSARNLNGRGAGCGRSFGDGEKGGFRLLRDFDVRLEKFRKRFDAGYQPRAGPRKITICLQRVDAPAADGRHGIPLLGKIHRAILVARLLRAIAARCDKENFWRRFDDVLQRDAERWRADLAENVLPAGHVNHLRDPVAANIEGFEPFEKCDSGTSRRWIQLLLEHAQMRANFLEECLGLRTAAGFFADQKNVTPDIS